ncbi:MAG: PaaI family thioesterase [Deltaproteobacteria bacterium]
MRTLNPDHIKAVLGLINQSPYFLLLSMKVTAIWEGFATMEMDIAGRHLNPFGGIHGGVYASLIDTAVYWAVYGDIGENDGLISLDLKVDHLAQVKEGHLAVEGKRIRTEKNICIAEAAVIDSGGKYLAYGTSRQMVKHGLQTMAQVLAVTGHEPLPPKFIRNQER